MSKSFWVLERDNRYVTITLEPSPHGGTYIVPGWTDDVKEARHWPSYQYADMERRGLGHPFWMADPVEHAWIEPGEYSDGLAAEIGRLKATLATTQAKLEAARGYAALEAENARLKQADADWHRESYDEGYREGNCDATGAAGELFDLVLKWATGERQLLDHQDQYTAEDLFDAITSHEQQLCENADDIKARVTALEARLREAEEVVKRCATELEHAQTVMDCDWHDAATVAQDARAFLSRAEG